MSAAAPTRAVTLCPLTDLPPGGHAEPPLCWYLPRGARHGGLSLSRAAGSFKEFSVDPSDDNAKVLLFRSKGDGTLSATSHKVRGARWGASSPSPQCHVRPAPPPQLQCTHFGAPLATGAFDADHVVCPWHCATFCVKTGDVEDAPALVRCPPAPRCAL